MTRTWSGREKGGGVAFDLGAHVRWIDCCPRVRFSGVRDY